MRITEELRLLRARRLTQARADSPVKTRANAIRKFGWKKDTYAAHEAGKRAFGHDDALQYAKAYGVSAAYLLAYDVDGDGHASLDTIDGAISVSRVPVIGRSAGGTWLEEDVSLGNAEIDLWVPPHPSAPAVNQYARLVVGNSVSRRIPDGYYAIFIRRDSFSGPIPYGTLVDVHRIRDGLHEYSVKAYYGKKLLTDSAELATQAEMPIDDSADIEIIIEGIAVGAYKDVS